MKTFKLTDILEENWSSNAKEELNLQMSQTKAILDAGDMIWNVMQSKGWKQKDLAEKMSVSKGYVSRLLGGMENLTVSTLARVMAILGEDLVLSVSNKNENIQSFNYYKINQESNHAPIWNTKQKYEVANQEVVTQFHVN